MSRNNRAFTRPLSVQTTYTPPSTAASKPMDAPESRPETPKHQTPAKADKQGTPSNSAHQRFVLTDPVAFRYLEEDPSTTVLERRRELQGYECYIVEQWTTSRTHPTFVITTYTGDPSHVVVVGVLSVPTDESSWSPRLRVYFKALNQYHARRRETPLGILMVTNLSGFPSSLTVITVPDGDLRKHRFDFFVNENLKRLGCSGRVGLTLMQPAPATIAKFQQLYRVSDKNDIYKSVIELVKLCQSALMLFDKLSVDYADGLLCDVTERALNEWWIDMGSEHYNIEPHDGILGPTTVSGLLGLLMGARNRLHSVNAPVPKDPFDIEAMKQGINAFQKQQRLTRSRRFDRRTLDRLHKASQKAADKDHWLVPKAVKSTVAELSGKGGEMVMDAVGRRDRAGIADIETVDIERFSQLVYGDRCKWLWQGKPMKKNKAELLGSGFDELQDALPTKKDFLQKSEERNGGIKATDGKATTDGDLPDAGDSGRHGSEKSPQTRANEAEDSDENANKGSMFKRATNLRNEAKSGITKVRDAVGFRGHKTKPSTDERDPSSPIQEQGPKRPTLQRAHTSPYNSPTSARSQDLETIQGAAAATQTSRLNVAMEGAAPEYTGRESIFGAQPSLQTEKSYDQSTEPRQGSRRPSESKTVDTAIQDRTNDNTEDSDASRSGNRKIRPNPAILLRRTVSASPYVGLELPRRLDEAYPRHLSFSLAEESVLNLGIAIERETTSDSSLRAQLAEQQSAAKEAKHLHSIVSSLGDDKAKWTREQLRNLETLLQQADEDQQTIDSLHFPHLETVQALQRQSESLLTEEQAVLEEGGKGIETLVARLDYEIDGLKGKVEDVEAALTDFEKGVVRVEERVAELEAAGAKAASWSCTVC